MSYLADEKKRDYLKIIFIKSWLSWKQLSAKCTAHAVSGWNGWAWINETMFQLRVFDGFLQWRWNKKHSVGCLMNIGDRCFVSLLVWLVLLSWNDPSVVDNRFRAISITYAEQSMPCIYSFSSSWFVRHNSRLSPK